MARPSRRRYGTGSIYRDPKTNRYIVQVPDGHGGYIRRRAADAKAAKALKAELTRKQHEALNVRGGAQTLQQFVNAWWEEVVKPKNLAPKTLEDYRSTVERYLLPHWGAYRLEEFDARRVLDMYHTLQRAFSDSLAHHAISKLRMILDVAVRWRYVPYNAVEVARPDIPALQRSTPVPLTLEQSVQLLMVVEGHRLCVLYHIALLLGLRLGELLGLQWDDIDFAQATLTVRRQVQCVYGQTSVHQRTKTPAGQRTLPIPPHLLERLHAHGECGRDSRLVFPSDEGTPMQPSNFERHWRGARNRKGEVREGMRGKAGLPKSVTFHHLRHTCATRLGELGVIEEVRAAILGHGKRGVTQHYTHATIQAMRRALEAYERELVRAAT
jgi:integrase